MSIISLLADPNCSSPANVDAGVSININDVGEFTGSYKIYFLQVAYRKDREQFTAIVKGNPSHHVIYGNESCANHSRGLLGWSFTAQVEASKRDIPEGFVMPQTEADFMLTAPPAIEEDENL